RAPVGAVPAVPAAGGPADPCRSVPQAATAPAAQATAIRKARTLTEVRRSRWVGGFKGPGAACVNAPPVMPGGPAALRTGKGRTAMYRFRFLTMVAAIVTGAALAAAPAALAAAQARPPAVATPANVDISQRHLNESEEAIAVNPTNPDNIVVFTNVGHAEAGLSAGMFLAVSFDGGKTWTKKLVALGAGDPLGDGCCDPSLSFDRYGNLFMTYLYQVEDQVPVALSTDGGLTFHVVANISQADLPGKKAGGDNRGLFRFVDQPTITAAHGEVWVVFNAGGPMVATGARVSGLGQVGAFIPVEVVPGTNNCTYGDISIGPSGQTMQACSLTETGQGGGKIFVNTDPDGLGPAGFGNRTFVTSTHVGGFDF